MSFLTFDQLRAANIARLPQFKNKHGEYAHRPALKVLAARIPQYVDGSDWSPAQWLQAVVGELGEYANIRKKFERGDITKEKFLELAAEELADVQVYLDLLAGQLGIDLGQATINKFNAVSNRVDSTVFL